MAPWLLGQLPANLLEEIIKPTQSLNISSKMDVHELNNYYYYSNSRIILAKKPQERNQLEDLDKNGRIIIKWIWKRMGVCGLYSLGLCYVERDSNKLHPLIYILIYIVEALEGAKNQNNTFLLQGILYKTDPTHTISNTTQRINCTKWSRTETRIRSN
jgi:hypothetical protein